MGLMVRNCEKEEPKREKNNNFVIFCSQLDTPRNVYDEHRTFNLVYCIKFEFTLSKILLTHRRLSFHIVCRHLPPFVSLFSFMLSISLSHSVGYTLPRSLIFYTLFECGARSTYTYVILLLLFIMYTIRMFLHRFMCVQSCVCLDLYLFVLIFFSVVRSIIFRICLLHFRI